MQVDRLIAVAGPEQMVEFGHLFRASTRKNLSDGHLWFSVGTNLIDVNHCFSIPVSV